MSLIKSISGIRGTIGGEISDNLTAAEYKVFHQGLEVWWWTFNEKDEEETE